MVTFTDKARPARDRPGDANDVEWVFLLYRLPREPSAPRIALWRATRRLGALLLADGLVALPASARNIEHVEWLAAGIEEQGGTASTWLARARTPGASEALVAQARAALDGEYRSVVREAARLDGRTSVAERRRAMRRLRAELHRIQTRDYFGAPSRSVAQEAVERLAEGPVDVLPARVGAR